MAGAIRFHPINGPSGRTITAANSHSTDVYTPQMVIEGEHQASGADGRAVLSAIEQSAKAPHIEIAIPTAERSSDGVHLEITAAAAKGATLYAVLADDADRSNVAHGENAGRTLDHVAVARTLVRVAKLDKSPLDQKIVIAIPPGAPDRRLQAHRLCPGRP